LYARLQILIPVIGGLVVAIALLGIIGSAIQDPHPHDIPVGLVGPAAATDQVSSAFAANAPGAFQFTSYETEAQGRAALDSRNIDGLLVLGDSSPRLVVAAANGDAVTGVITTAFSNIFKSQGSPLQVEVVHPFAAGDAHGLVLFFLVVAVIISALAAQLLLVTATKDTVFAQRILVVLAFGALAGPILFGTAELIAGDYGSGIWAAMGLLMLAGVALGAAVLGLIRLLGRPGIGVAVLVVVLLDLVSSGGPVGSQLLPDFYRLLSPWMAAGPLYSGLVGALYFNGAGVEGALLILPAWFAAGMVLMLLGEFVWFLRNRGNEPQEIPQ
jgi:hypothetical protein